MSTFVAEIGSLLALAILLSLFILRQTKRKAIDVADDLYDFESDLEFSTNSDSKKRDDISKELSAGIFLDKKEKEKFEFKKKFVPLVLIFVLGSVSLFLPDPSLKKVIIFSGIGLCIGYIYGKSLERKAQENFTSDITFYLPIVMERIVMAVQAGLDIIPALKVVSDLDKKTRNQARKNPEAEDPVTRLMSLVVKLSDSGIGFEQALNDVVSAVDSSPLKHAFIHLGLAQREGGELIMPLKELSDSTQLYFQESVEEEVAKLPVKATMPLLCTFAGLIVCFITSPLIQILEITANTSLSNF